MWAVKQESTYTLIELASLATCDKAFTIWIPGHTGKAIFMRLTHLCTQLPCLWKRIRREKKHDTPNKMPIVFFCHLSRGAILLPAGLNRFGIWNTDSLYLWIFCTGVRDAVPEYSTTKAQSNHLDHRLPDRHHQGSRPGTKHHMHDLPESSSTSTAWFPGFSKTLKPVNDLSNLLDTQKMSLVPRYWGKLSKWLITVSTCHTMTVVSLDPVASFEPSLENLQNQTSLQCSVRICWV